MAFYIILFAIIRLLWEEGLRGNAQYYVQQNRKNYVSNREKYGYRK